MPQRKIIVKENRNLSVPIEYHAVNIRWLSASKNSAPPAYGELCVGITPELPLSDY